LARRLGITQKRLRALVRVRYVKVAEYQARGVVHFHAVIRLDGSEGPDTRPPNWATTDLLTEAVQDAASIVQVATPDAGTVPARDLRWGDQLDIRPITTTGELTDNAVAGYVAKYATKAAECTGTLDRRITNADAVNLLPVTAHARRLIAECLGLGLLPEFEHLRLIAWAHMLGFRGHFSTKSRRYSTTLGALRAARAEHQAERHKPDLTAEPDTVLVLGHWQFTGRGYKTPPSIGHRPIPPAKGGHP